MLLRYITATSLLFTSGIALAGGKQPPPPVCAIFLHGDYGITPAWTSAWVIAATVCLVVVLAARLRRNRVHTSRDTAPV